MKQTRIVFLYSAPTGGHRECAEAVRSVFQRASGSQVQTFGLDAIRTLYPLLGGLIAKTYLEILKYTPQIWDFLYDHPDLAEITRELRQLFSFLDSPKLKALLMEYRPNVFVCTHAVPAGLIAEQKRRGNCKIPLVAVVTDYDVHSFLVYPDVDLYIVANAESKEALLARGIEGTKIRICGIPVNPAFNRKISQSEARKKLGLDIHRPAVLIMGGTRGLGPIEKILEELLLLKPAPQILIVTGDNKELAGGISEHKKTRGVQIYEFTKQVPLLMDASDLLITKPGGLTSSEALIKGLPMLIVHPIPGQEERNARYLIKNGAAVQIKELKDLKEKVKYYLSHPRELSRISERMKGIATPEASYEAAGEILKAAEAAQASTNREDTELVLT